MRVLQFWYDGCILRDAESAAGDEVYRNSKAEPEEGRGAFVHRRYQVVLVYFTVLRFQSHEPNHVVRLDPTQSNPIQNMNSEINKYYKIILGYIIERCPN